MCQVCLMAQNLPPGWGELCGTVSMVVAFICVLHLPVARFVKSMLEQGLQRLQVVEVEKV